ncbi:MAG: hypothetical protein K8E66_08695 [Phycisphaerales bacterium]|nr:hypothetical protein [Phycisphaerales bacterium]
MLDMSYEEFVKADLVVHIRSSLLGEDIAIASNEEAATRAWDGVVVYLMEEFRHLYAGGELNEAALRVLHRLKRQLPNSRMTGTHGMRPGAGGTER